MSTCVLFLCLLTFIILHIIFLRCKYWRQLAVMSSYGWWYFSCFKRKKPKKGKGNDAMNIYLSTQVFLLCNFLVFQWHSQVVMIVVWFGVAPSFFCSCYGMKNLYKIYDIFLLLILSMLKKKSAKKVTAENFEKTYLLRTKRRHFFSCNKFWTFVFCFKKRILSKHLHVACRPSNLTIQSNFALYHFMPVLRLYPCLIQLIP